MTPGYAGMTMQGGLTMMPDYAGMMLRSELDGVRTEPDVDRVGSRRGRQIWSSKSRNGRLGK